MRYRSDIDGLRAIAVILVLMFHGGISVFPSGFIGVDIFFVISGFLITEIIRTAIKNQSFSLSDFYLRRLWRLQPASITLILFTILLASFFYLPDDFTSYLKSVKYSTLLISNQYFASTTTAYAAQDSAYLLLLHTWSLSIEWQWYLILPAVAMILHRYLTGMQITVITVLLTIGMLVLSLYLSHQHQTKSYYFLTSRIFEFMIGSCLTLLDEKKFQLRKFFASLLGCLSLGSIIYIATRRDIVIGYPDYHAVVVSIAAALLIFVGRSTNGIITQLLSWKPLVAIGTISYSLYLWHWPIFATGRYLGLKENVVFTLTCYALTLIFASLSYLLIEKRFRKKRYSLTKSLVILVIVPIIIASGFYSLSRAHHGFPGRFGSDYARIESVLNKFAVPARETCFNGAVDFTSTTCTLGKTQSSREALLIGDSNSNHFWRFFDVIGMQADIKITAISSSSCLALPDIKQYQWGMSNKLNTTCLTRTRQYFEQIAAHSYDYVIIGERWANYLTNIALDNGQPADPVVARKIILEKLDNAITLIEQTGAKVILVKEIAQMPKNYMECFYSPFKTRTMQVDNNSYCGFDLPVKNRAIESIFSEIERRHPQVKFIDPQVVQCKNDRCVGNIDGIPIYRDKGHITDHASQDFGVRYLEKHGNPLQH